MTNPNDDRATGWPVRRCRAVCRGLCRLGFLLLLALLIVPLTVLMWLEDKAGTGRD